MAGVELGDFSNFFDHIDDLLDIPDESCNNNNGESDFLCGDFKDFPSIWTPADDMFTETKSDNKSHSSSDLSNELYVPYEDIAQLEWLSTFVEDSFSPENSLTIEVANTVPNSVVSPSSTQFQMSSPISVLESSSSSCAGGKVMPVKFHAPTSGRRGRARSERPRPPTFTPWPSVQLISPSASFTNAGNFEFESVGEFGKSLKIRKSASSTEHKKKKKVKLSDSVEVDQNENPNPLAPQGAVRKCQHCEITKTPQWRAGPNGPKTLCNACGVRYKSGRLFPEYRPAASPTFVPSIHSNSHKKVLEMRVKTCSKTGSPLIEHSSNTQIELVPNKNSPLDFM